MAKSEYPLHHLEAYLPENCFEDVGRYLDKHKVCLTITRARKSVLGDYRNAHRNAHHRISVNGNLNPYSFLLTLLHELAHLLTYEAYGNRVPSHGKEWKTHYRMLLQDFIKKGVFPPDILTAIKTSLHNPGASACAETALMRVLMRYDADAHSKLLLENLSAGANFIYSNRIYKKGKQRTKRFECVDINSGRMYLFSPVCEVREVISQ